MRCPSILVFAVLAVAAPAPARAQPADAIDKVTQLNRDALAAIDKREFEKARELLKRALDVCASAGLERHAVAARTRVHMGVVIIEGFKNPELGRKQFARALEIEPGITITKSLSTPELEEAFAQAKAAGVGGGTAGNADDEASPLPTSGPGIEGQGPPGRAAGEAGTAGRAPVSSAGLSYHTLSEVKQGSHIIVTVTVEDTLRFHKLVLAYRPPGTREFLGREMEPVGNGTYTAEIPDRATTGPSVAYYIEAQDDDGQPVAQRGSEERPLVISFAAPARAATARAEAVAEKREVRRRSDEDEEEEEGARYFASLQLGSGVGYVSGMGEVNADMPVAGTVSGALLGHVVPEIGYWIEPGLLLSLQGRVQWVSGPTEIDKDGHHPPVPAALAMFAKATWVGGSAALRPFVSGGLGGGQIRHVVTFSNLKDCGPNQDQTCVDSVVAGPLLAEVGAGLLYKLGGQLDLVLSSNVEAAAPSFTINLDVNAGVGFSF